MRDGDVGRSVEVGGRSCASGDEAIHAIDEGLGELAVVALSGRGKDDLEFGSQFFREKSLDHFVIATGVKEDGVLRVS